MDWTETAAMVARARAEIPVRFGGPDGNLCGIVTPPAGGAASAEKWVIFPGRPRFGSRRLPVLAARILAAAGFSCLRFDFHGTGESDGEVANPDRTTPYGDDVAAAIRYLRAADGGARVLLVGHCFGALSALAAFESEPEAIDGLFFAAAPLAAERIDPVAASAGARGGLRGAVRSLISGAPRPAAAPRLSEKFVSAFDALIGSRASALFLYGTTGNFSDEVGLLERAMAALDGAARERVRLERWPGSLHSVGCELAIYERAISWAIQLSSANARMRATA